MKLFVRPIFYYWLLLIFLLIVFTFLVPPFQKADESLHFNRAFSLIYGKGKPQPGSNEANRYAPAWLYQSPQSVTDFSSKMLTHTILMRSDIKFPTSLYKQKYPWVYDTSTTSAPAVSVYILPAQSYVIYLPAIFISKVFDNLLITFYMMRFSAALLYLLAIILGLKIIPKRYLWLFGFFSLTPMVIHQVTAISYDAPSLIFGIILFSLFLYLMEQKRVSMHNLILFIFVLITFNAMKGGYYASGLLLIPVMLKMVKKKKYAFIVISIFLSCWVIAAFYYNVVSLSFSNLISSNYQFQLFYLYPGYTLRFVINSIFSEQVFWIQGLVGLFGWLDYAVPLVYIVFYFFFLGVVTIRLLQHDKPKASFLMSLLIIFVPIAIWLTIVYYVSLTATTAGYPNAMSVQGRYFLICIPFFIYGVSQAYVNKPRFVKIFFACAFLVCIIFLIGRMVYLRYYDYSHTYANKEDLQKQLENKEIISSSDSTVIVTSTIYTLPAIPGRKINALQLLLASSNVKVDIPYVYSISDKFCNRKFAGNIIDPTLIDKPGIATIQVQPFINTEEALCVTIVPATRYIFTKGYLHLATDENNKPIYQFLYIPQ